MQVKAIYNVPFLSGDFDYTKMVIDCGARVSLHKGKRLEVIGSPDAIELLSRDLNFDPVHTEGGPR